MRMRFVCLCLTWQCWWDGVLHPEDAPAGCMIAVNTNDILTFSLRKMYTRLLTS